MLVQHMCTECRILYTLWKSLPCQQSLISGKSGGRESGMVRAQQDLKTEGMMKEYEPIYVTKPFLPPLEEFQEYLEHIWSTKQLTNKGIYHDMFEKKLAEYLNVKYVSLFSNGTLALISALRLAYYRRSHYHPFQFCCDNPCSPLEWNQTGIM